MINNGLDIEKTIFLENGMEVIDFKKMYFPLIIYPHYANDRTVVYSHWHNDLELTCIFHGSCIFYCNGIKKQVKEMGVNIANCKEMHYAIPEISKQDMEKKIKGVTIQIKKDFLQEYIPDLNEINFVIQSEEDEKKIADIMYQIYSYYLEDTVSNRIKLMGLSYDLVLLLYEKCSKNKELISINIQKDIERIQIIITYINEHYNEELKQQELADRFYFSREYFSKFFKAQTGLSFKEYIMKYRVRKAGIELMTTSHSIADIAINNGFTDLNHFIIWFKKYYDSTPYKYRQEHKLDV